MSYDHWKSTDPEDWAEAEEREEVTRAMGRMDDEETPQEEQRRIASDFDFDQDYRNYLDWKRQQSPPEIDDSCPF
jgi:hypothetical protein